MAMVLHALVPQGFMLAKAGANGNLVSIRICSERGEN